MSLRHPQAKIYFLHDIKIARSYHRESYDIKLVFSFKIKTINNRAPFLFPEFNQSQGARDLLEK